MRLPHKIIGLLCLISIFNSCKKEFSDEFDPVIGKWKWYKTDKNIEDVSGTVQIVEPYTYASGTTDQFEVEIKKKGLVTTYKNDEIQHKYRTKHSKASHTDFTYLETVWHYTIEYKNNKTLNMKYYVNGDTLVLFDFPYTISGNNFYYTNHFIRE